MRICIDARPLRQAVTGLGRYTLNLVQQLARLDQDSEYILLRRPLYPGPLVTQANVREITVRSGILSPRNILTGAALINRLRADVYHSLFHFLPLGLRAGCVVITLHDLIWVEHRRLAYASRWRRTWKCGLAAPLIGRAVARADHVIAVSASTRRAALDRYRLPPSKVSVVHHGVDAASFGHDDSSLLPAGLGEAPFVFALSNTLPYKNAPRLLRAFAAVAGVRPRLQLVVAGRGEGYDSLARLSRRLGIGDRVRLCPQLTDAEVRACLSRAVLFAFPSLVEGFGLPVLEAMSAGCPVLTSNRSSMVEVAGEDAELVDPEQVEAIAAGMRRLLDDPRRRQDLAARGRGRAARFTWEECGRRTLELYRRLAPPGTRS